MRAPSKLWEMTYSHSRRKHRHRCRACWRTVEAGERVWMAKIANRKTWVLHSSCATTPHPCGTYLDAFREWTAPKPAASYRLPAFQVASGVNQ